MKAVVVEINKNQAAVLSDDGCVSTIKNQNYELGQIVQINNIKVSFAKKITALAASAAAVVILGTGTWAYASPYTYVSIDVNPSIEFTLNRFDRVLKVDAVNEDGEDIINQIEPKELSNVSIQEAMIKTVDQIDTAGYLSGSDESGIVIATSSENSEKAIELAEELQLTIEEETSEHENEVIVV